MRWLVVAHEKEIPGFRERVKAGFTAHALGIGQFAALAELARLMASEKPAGVLLAGTCGSPHKEDIFKLFQCQHFVLPFVEHEELPEFLPRAARTEAAAEFAGLPGATLLQNHGISIEAAKFSRNQGYIPPDFPRPVVENMEAASLALYCHEKGVPFTAVVCVTNQIGPGGRAEWKENFKRAGEILAQKIFF
ncbi:MAG: hypothetical protein KF713_00175 [Turneriella sp.]|nr:hypothetical protein [Turneriella sp.]